MGADEAREAVLHSTQSWLRVRSRGKLRFWTVQVAHPRAEPGVINHGLLDVVPPRAEVLFAVLMRSVDVATGAHQPVVVGGALVTAVHAFIAGNRDT